jgi:hypothetical protein
VLDEPDPGKQLRLNAHSSSTGKLRIGAIVGERGWTPDRYEQWCADTAGSQLLAGEPS